MTAHKIKDNTMHLIKPDLKFMDFGHLTIEFNKTNSFSKERKHELAVRINGFALYMSDTLIVYFSKGKPPKPVVYETIEKRFKEFVRRMKISFAKNETYYKQCVNYWKWISEVLKEDALLLADSQLLKAIETFRTKLDLIVTK